MGMSNSKSLAFSKTPVRKHPAYVKFLKSKIYSSAKNCPNTNETSAHCLQRYCVC